MNFSQAADPIIDGRPSSARASGGCRTNESNERQVAEKRQDTGIGVSNVAARYASALFEVARDEGAIDGVLRDLDTFDRMMIESPDLARLVRSPVFAAEDQVRAVGTLLDRAGISGLAANIVRLVASKRRLFVLPGLIRGFRAEVARARGIVPAEVRLAEQPSARMMDDIRTAVRDMAGSEVDLDVKIDPALIGGLIVKIGSRMVDASLKTKLNSIRLAMKEAR